VTFGSEKLQFLTCQLHSWGTNSWPLHQRVNKTSASGNRSVDLCVEHTGPRRARAFIPPSALLHREFSTGRQPREFLTDLRALLWVLVPCRDTKRTDSAEIRDRGLARVLRPLPVVNHPQRQRHRAKTGWVSVYARLSKTLKLSPSGKIPFNRNASVFLDRLDDVVKLRGGDVVRAQLPSCLRGAALQWYTTELTDIEKASFRSPSNTNPQDRFIAGAKALKTTMGSTCVIGLAELHEHQVHCQHGPIWDVGSAIFLDQTAPCQGSRVR